MTLDKEVKNLAGVITLIHGLDSSGKPNYRRGYTVLQSQGLPLLSTPLCPTKEAIYPENALRDSPLIATDLAIYSIGYPFFTANSLKKASSVKFMEPASNILPSSANGRLPNCAVLSPTGTKQDSWIEKVQVLRTFKKRGLMGLLGGTEQLLVTENKLVQGEPAPILHYELIPNGSSEPAVVLQVRGMGPSYDHTDRRSAHRVINLYLPQSVGQELIQHGAQDPTSFGRIVRDTVQNKLGFSAEYIEDQSPTERTVRPEVVLAPKSVLSSRDGQVEFDMGNKPLSYEFKLTGQ